MRAAAAPAEGDGVAPSESSKSKGVAVQGSEAKVDSLATWHSNHLKVFFYCFPGSVCTLCLSEWVINLCKLRSQSPVLSEM